MGFGRYMHFDYEPMIDESKVYRCLRNLLLPDSSNIIMDIMHIAIIELTDLYTRKHYQDYRKRNGSDVGW